MSFLFRSAVTMIRKITGLMVVFALGGVVGCGGGLKSVEGLVTLDGVPVEGASVSFTPEGEGQPAFGVTDSNGKFVLQTINKAGANPGTYKVTVTKTKPVKISDPKSMTPDSPEYKAMKSV